ncbi:unnamed protein product [Mytilus coruscus]|uniref:B box-type domain-containing protein n=1 Tax=Mytilus coruscus TaxID=42192 RepID=A0A6J8EPW2_MYTCO|nr:unnamed protein product [Mytilus coruscus]
MASKLPHCDICSLRGILKPATIWYSECDESICSECKQHHDLCKATKSHHTLPIEDFLKLPAFVRKINIQCGEHEKKTRVVLLCTELDDYYHGIETRLKQIQRIKLVDNQALQIMNTVKDTKKDVIKHLDDLEQKAIEDIPKKKEQLTESIVKFTTAINDRWGRVKNFLA